MFDFNSCIKAASVDHAIELLRENPERRLLAGGTDILIKLRKGKPGFSELVDIHGLEELHFLRKDDDNNILIGSGTSFTDIIESELLQEQLPMLCDAAQSVGGPQIRNVATIGGNICNGITSADSAMGLFCLDAELMIKGIDGMREIPIDSFYLGPGKVDLQHGDVLLGFKITRENYQGYGGYYYKYAMRDAMDIATIGCAVHLRLERRRMADFRIAYGVAGPVPLRCRQAERFAAGQEVTDALVDTIADKVREDVNPRTSWRASRDFRMNIIEELARRATREALLRAGGEENV